jgi:hypothetical protein
MTETRERDGVAEIRERVFKTMCSTVRFPEGSETIEGRISSDDFAALCKEIDRLRSQGSVPERWQLAMIDAALMWKARTSPYTMYSAVLSAAPQPPLSAGEAVKDVDAERIREVVAEGPGHWRTCSGCHESEDGYDIGVYPHSAVFGCKLGGGCSECGGLGAVWDATDYSDIGEFLSRAPSPNPPVDGLREAPGMVLVPAERVIACRDALIDGDRDEAYHQLRMMVDPECEVHRRTGDHWSDVSALASTPAPVGTAGGSDAE